MVAGSGDVLTLSVWTMTCSLSIVLLRCVDKEAEKLMLWHRAAHSEPILKTPSCSLETEYSWPLAGAQFARPPDRDRCMCDPPRFGKGPADIFFMRVRVSGYADSYWSK